MSLICESCDTQSELCGSCHHGHIVCSDCLTAQVKVLLEDYRETKMACSVMGYSAEISPDWYDTLVEVRLMWQLAQLSQLQQPEDLDQASIETESAEQATLSVTTQCPRCKTGILVQDGCRFVVCRCGRETCLTKIKGKDKANHYCGGHNGVSKANGDSLICEICLKCNYFALPVDRLPIVLPWMAPMTPLVSSVSLLRTEINGHVAYQLPEPPFHVGARTRRRRITAMTTN